MSFICICVFDMSWPGISMPGMLGWLLLAGACCPQLTLAKKRREIRMMIRLRMANLRTSIRINTDAEKLFPQEDGGYWRLQR